MINTFHKSSLSSAMSACITVSASIISDLQSDHPINANMYVAKCVCGEANKNRALQWKL